MSTAIHLHPHHDKAFFIHGVALTFVCRYITLSVYIVLLLEHLASLPEEIELVWKSSWNIIQCSFLLYRYSTIAGVTVLMHVISGLSGSLSESFCKHAIAAMLALITFSLGIADALVMLRVSVLWGRQRAILGTLAFSFLLTYSIAVVCAVLAATKLVPSTKAVFDICAPFARPSIWFGVWIPGVAFDTIVLSLASWNACARPRTEKTQLTQAMHRDGIAFFLVLAGLRIVNLVLAIWGGPFFIIGVCIAWPLSAVTLSRLVFHLRSVEARQFDTGMESQYPEPVDVPQMLLLDDLPQGHHSQTDRWESTGVQSQSEGSTAQTSTYTSCATAK